MGTTVAAVLFCQPGTPVVLSTKYPIERNRRLAVKTMEYQEVRFSAPRLITLIMLQLDDLGMDVRDVARAMQPRAALK